MTERKIKGNVTELKVMEAFIERGYTVSIPYGDSAKYDLLVDLGNKKIIRIQTKFGKTETEEGETFKIRGYSSRRNYKSIYSPDDIDYLATSYRGNCYLVPISLMDKRNSIKLRLSAAKNQQEENIHWAEDFLIDKVLLDWRNGNATVL